MTISKLKRLAVLAWLLIPCSAYAYNDSLLGLWDKYEKAVKRNTQHVEVYGIRDLDAHFIVFATFHTEDFRQAFSQLYDKLYPQGQEGLANELGHPWDGRPPQVEFFVGLYAKAKGLKKMVGSKNLWDLSLNIDGKYYKPASVEEVTITPFEYKFYPYLDPWSRAYKVSFPVPLAQGESSGVSLELASVAGRRELKFK